MTSSLTIFEKLAAPFQPDAVSWRVGSTTADKKRGMALAYIDARDVMQRLDDVLGPENWSDSYAIHGPRVICTLSIFVSSKEANGPGGWVSKSDGAGDTDVESEKGAISDAFKRAAVKWGIGRYLYNLDSPWVEIETFGKSSKIVKTEHAKLRALLERDARANAPASQHPLEEPPAPTESELWQAIAACKWHDDVTKLMEQHPNASDDDKEFARNQFRKLKSEGR